MKGHKNPKIAYEALNRQPKTVASALDIVVQLQHNYQATLGRDYDYNTKQRSRRVSWKDESEEEEYGDGQYGETEYVRQVTTPFRKPENSGLQSEIRALRDLLERPLLKESKSIASSASQVGCFQCGDKNHFKRDCHKRPRSPSPVRRVNDDNGNDEGKPVYKIGRGHGLFIPIQVNGNIVEAIVDTGADVTVLSRSFTTDIGLPSTNASKACLLNAESGKEMEADMNVEVDLKLGKTEIAWKVCIAPIRDDVLIGMDFLKEVDGIIMTRQGDLLIKDELIPGRYSKETDYHVCRVTVANETILEPMAETNVVGKVDCPKESVIGVLDPASLKNGTYTGSVLVPMKEKIPVRIINPTHQKVKLPTGTHLGKLVEVI